MARDSEGFTVVRNIPRWKVKLLHFKKLDMEYVVFKDCVAMVKFKRFMGKKVIYAYKKLGD